jgi:hypothetical protein
MKEREGLPSVVVSCQTISEMGGGKGLPEAATRCLEMEKCGEVRSYRELPENERNKGMREAAGS